MRGRPGAPTHGQQTLADGRTADAALERMDYREYCAIIKKHLCGFKMPLLQNAKIEPPRKVTDGIEITESGDFKSRFLEQMPKVGSAVTSKMAKILVDWGIDFRTSGDEQAKIALSFAQQASITFQFGLVFSNMLQHVYAEHGIPILTGRQIFCSSLNQFVIGKFRAVLGAEFGIGFNGHDAPDIFHAAQGFCYLTDTGANFGDVAMQELRKFG